MTDTNIVKVNDVLPTKYAELFSFQHFNHMQSLLVKCIYEDNDNLVIASPTGSGKTVLHELAIMRVHNVKNNDFKCVLIAPNKALCQQRAQEWTMKFGKLGIIVLEVTGDVDMQQSMRYVAKASIIITTPEKWDSLTRSWRRHLFLLGSIDLMLIDEIHHLAEDRGATLETIIIRMKILSETYLDKLEKSKYAPNNDHKKDHETENNSNNQSDNVENNSKIVVHSVSNTAMVSPIRSNMRIIALSATLPNIVDIGNWLGCKQSGIHYFDEGFRPVPLTTYTLSYPNYSNLFLFERSLDEKVIDVIVRYSENKQTLIFCASKKSTENLTLLLSKKYKYNHNKDKNIPLEIRTMMNNVSIDNLRRLLPLGYGYHHAGISPDDRVIIENCYLNGYIHILCSTSTLAHGVNLPAHLVIIKGTNCWRGGTRGYEKMSKSDIIQMMGRAGRPGLDSHGIAVIMTSVEDKGYYEGITMTPDIVESTLPYKLSEAICCEISQTVIASVADTITWLKSTYFYVRVKRNPTHYGYDTQQIQSDNDIETLVQDLCMKSIMELSEASIISYDPSTRIIEAKLETHIMTRHMISTKSMSILLTTIDPLITLDKLILELSKCEEVSKPIRRSDKKLLYDHNKLIRFPLKNITMKYEYIKVYILLQMVMLHVFIPEFTLRVEQSEIVDVMVRILSALQELCIEKLYGHLLEQCLLFDRALRNRLWETQYTTVFIQCPGMTETLIKKLTTHHIIEFDQLVHLKSSEIQTLLQCTLMEADSLHHFARYCVFHRLHIQLNVLPSSYDHSNIIVNTIVDDVQDTLEIQITPQNHHNMMNIEDTHQIFSEQKIHYHILCYNVITGRLYCYRRLHENYLYPHSINIPLKEPMSELEYHKLKCIALCTVVGLDTVINSSVDSSTNTTNTTEMNTNTNVTTNSSGNSNSSKNKGTNKTTNTTTTAANNMTNRKKGDSNKGIIRIENQPSNSNNSNNNNNNNGSSSSSSSYNNNSIPFVVNDTANTPIKTTAIHNSYNNNTRNTDATTSTTTATTSNANIATASFHEYEYTPDPTLSYNNNTTTLSSYYSFNNQNTYENSHDTTIITTSGGGRYSGTKVNKNNQNELKNTSRNTVNSSQRSLYDYVISSPLPLKTSSTNNNNHNTTAATMDNVNINNTTSSHTIINNTSNSNSNTKNDNSIQIEGGGVGSSNNGATTSTNNNYNDNHTYIPTISNSLNNFTTTTTTPLSRKSNISSPVTSYTPYYRKNSSSSDNNNNNSNNNNNNKYDKMGGGKSNDNWNNNNNSTNYNSNRYNSNNNNNSTHNNSTNSNSYSSNISALDVLKQKGVELYQSPSTTTLLYRSMTSGGTTTTNSGGHSNRVNNMNIMSTIYPVKRIRTLPLTPLTMTAGSTSSATNTTANTTTIQPSSMISTTITSQEAAPISHYNIESICSNNMYTSSSSSSPQSLPVAVPLLPSSATTTYSIDNGTNISYPPPNNYQYAYTITDQNPYNQRPLIGQSYIPYYTSSDQRNNNMSFPYISTNNLSYTDPYHLYSNVLWSQEQRDEARNISTYDPTVFYDTNSLPPNTQYPSHRPINATRSNQSFFNDMNTNTNINHYPSYSQQQSPMPPSQYSANGNITHYMDNNNNNNNNIRYPHQIILEDDRYDGHSNNHRIPIHHPQVIQNDDRKRQYYSPYNSTESTTYFNPNPYSRSPSAYESLSMRSPPPPPPSSQQYTVLSSQQPPSTSSHIPNRNFLPLFPSRNTYQSTRTTTANNIMPNMSLSSPYSPSSQKQQQQLLLNNNTPVTRRDFFEENSSDNTNTNNRVDGMIPTNKQQLQRQQQQQELYDNHHTITPLPYSSSSFVLKHLTSPTYKIHMNDNNTTPMSSSSSNTIIIDNPTTTTSSTSTIACSNKMISKRLYEEFTAEKSYQSSSENNNNNNNNKMKGYNTEDTCISHRNIVDISSNQKVNTNITNMMNKKSALEALYDKINNRSTFILPSATVVSNTESTT